MWYHDPLRAEKPLYQYMVMYLAKSIKKWDYKDTKKLVFATVMLIGLITSRYCYRHQASLPCSLNNKARLGGDNNSVT